MESEANVELLKADLRNSLDQLEQTVRNIELLLTGPQFFLEEERDKLINQIDIQTEIFIAKANETRIQLIQEINEHYEEKIFKM